MPLNIIDTAGIREAGGCASPDVVERIGIERTWAEVASRT
jgi:tRNA modification GTPase